jgi:hypothetical protein
LACMEAIPDRITLAAGQGTVNSGKHLGLLLGGVKAD